MSARGTGKEIVLNRPRLILVVLAWCTVLAAACFVTVDAALANQRKAATIEQLQAEVQALRQQIRRMQVDPPCDDGTETLRQVERLIAADQSQAAIPIIDLATDSHDRPLCPAARSALARYRYEASLDALLLPDGEFTHSPAAEEQQVGMWLQIESQADQDGLGAADKRPPLAIARAAYTVGLWALADRAYRQAWATSGAQDASVRWRYSLLRNWGNSVARTGGAGAADRAAVLLGTALALAQRYGLSGGEACDDIEALLDYADCHEAVMVADAGEPLLQTSAQSPGGSHGTH